ncbi:hypothetical protein FE257_012860 [Aspergillus nanangensis]|uniref:Uncharacterized protein n=1 Tax=Aspergillus nanangensis TaxID=2582783 RepID=A0AAD4CFU9_ASPNN|nr:hypothetical protein FE257_012860 [Aspergillus nanangensis]
MDSGSLNSGSYHASASCASDDQESSFLTKARLLRWAQLGIAILVFTMSVSAIACEAVPLHHYRQTTAFEQAWLYLWPLNLDVRPTVALLACGCIITLQALLFIISALLPSPRSHIKRSNIMATATATCGFITALIGVCFAIYRPGSTSPSGFSGNETLHSWTCKWKNTRGLDSRSSDGALTSPPVHFARDCTATEAGFALMCVLIGLEVVMGVTAGVGVYLERSVLRQRGQERLQLEKIEITTKYPGT